MNFGWKSYEKNRSMETFVVPIHGDIVMITC